MKTTFAKRFCRFNSFVVSVILISFLFSSCTADLGKFDMNGNYEDYYEAFGDVSGLYDNNKSVAEKTYDFERSIFNDYTVNLEWENEEDKVSYEEYCYIVIPFKEEMKIESIVLFVAKDSSVLNNMRLEFSAFYFRDETERPTNIKLLTSDDTRIVEEDDGNGGTIEVEEEIQYDDPKKEDRNSFSIKLVNNSFDAFELNKFRQVNDGKEAYVSDNCLNVKDGSFLYIRCENNSGLNKDTMQPCSFSFINLLVRKV